LELWYISLFQVVGLDNIVLQDFDGTWRLDELDLGG